MASVTIGLEDEKSLLKWFNQVHAALLNTKTMYKIAKKDRYLTGATTKGNNLIKKANSDLIAALQSVIKEIEEDSAGR